MDENELPPELEVRVVKTMLSTRPKEQGLLLGAILVFACSLMSLWSWRSEMVFNALVASGQKVFQDHEFHRLFSSLLLHGDFEHLLSNSYMLLVLSVFVFGTLALSFRGAVVLLILTALSGGLVNWITLKSYSPTTNLLGISGVVYFLAGFWFVNYLLIDRRRSLAARVVRVIGVSLVILFPTTFEETTSYAAHFHGFWLGLLVGSVYFYIQRKNIRGYEELGIV